MDIKNKSNQKLGELMKEFSENHKTIKKEILLLIEKLDSVESNYKQVINELKERYKIK